MGFRQVVITLGYMGDVIEESLGDGSLFGVEIAYVYEKTKLGTAGSVKNAQKHLDGQDFLVVGGDHVTDLNVLELYRTHQRMRVMATIGLISIDDPREYGIAEIDAGYDIGRFREKPAPGEIFSNLASTGMYVCSPSIFDYIPEGKQYDFARDLFPALMDEGITIKGWLARGAQVHGPVHLGDSVTLGKNSKVIGPVSIGQGTTIGDNVLVGPYTSIGDACIIRNNAKIFSSSIYNRVLVGADSTISGSIIDNDTHIGERCSIENDTVIGPRVVLRDRVVIHSRTRLWPEVVVADGTIVKENVLNEKFDTRCNGS
jgi:mannose-1-phosphate guanylyltransferase